MAAGAAGIMVLGTLLTADLVRYHKWSISTNNSNAAEGLAWAKGQLEIRKASPDTVKVDGRIYNVFPPLFSAVSAAVLWCSHVFAGKYVFPSWLYVGILLAPLLAAASWALYTCTGSIWKTVVLALGYWAGTSLLPVLVLCRPGAVWHVNQVLSQIGLFLIVGDCLGRRRGWPSLIGLVIAAWSRQLTLLYVLPIALLLPRRKGPLIAAAVTLVGILLLPMALNAMKFGSPFESGYRLMYVGQDDAIARRAQRGLFAVSFLRDNLWAMNTHFPDMHLSTSGLVLKTNGWGSSMWLGTPLLLYVFIAARQWWRDWNRRMLMLGTVPVVAGLLLYHNTGYFQPGYYRFSLDFLPIWLGVIAPFVWGRVRTPLLIVILAWSVLYFRAAGALTADIIPQPKSAPSRSDLRQEMPPAMS